MPRSTDRPGKSLLFVVVQAGGTGTRLWPRSRKRYPKQLLDIVNRRTMLQDTVERVEPLVPAGRILVVTGAEYADEARRQLPNLPPANVLVEPAGRGTGPSIGLAAVALSRLAPGATMISLHADHVIANAARFRDLLRVAAAAASPGHLVTLGIQPTYPETGYGYIERGRVVRRIRGVSVYRVVRFIEKPPASQAAAFVSGRHHYWNSGTFVWRVDTILQAMQRWLPELHSQLATISAAWDTPERDRVLADIWSQVGSISIDVGIMERAEEILVVPADIGWSDVGSWASVADILATTKGGNVILGDSEHLGLDTEDSLVYAPGRILATIGLRSLVVVDTGDVLFICPKTRAQDVKKLVDQLREAGRDELL
jgi:mannose-1-phosphate guanylyltransferase